MDISARTMYGLRALIILARARTDSPMSIQAIAEVEALPGKFLEGIMGDLKRGGFVMSRRGANGGYLLARAASEISLLSLIRHLDGPVAPQAYGADAGCATDVERAFVPVWTEIREATIRVLDRYTVQSIADAVKEHPGKDFWPNYQI